MVLINWEKLIKGEAYNPLDFFIIIKALNLLSVILQYSIRQALLAEVESRLTFETKDIKLCPRGQGRPRGPHLCLLETVYIVISLL